MIAKAQNTPLDKMRVLQRKLYLAAKTNPKRKFGVLYDKVCREDVLRAACAQVRANKGAPGIDQQSFEIIEKEVGAGAFLDEVRKKLIAKRYKPLPVRRVYIPKPDGSQRPVGIPVITDRVVQAAVKIVIEPLFRGDFQRLLVWLPASEERPSGVAGGLQVAELQMPLGCRCGPQVIFRHDSA